MTTSFVSPRLLMIGGGAVGKVAEVLGQFGLSKPQVVTDPWMVSSGTVEKALAPLRAGGRCRPPATETVGHDELGTPGIGLLCCRWART